MSEENIKPVVPVESNEASPAVKTNYGANSHKAKAKQNMNSEKSEPPKGEKIVEGGVALRKETLWDKIRVSLTGDDAQSVGNYLLFDVIIPGTKNIVSDLVTQGVERALFGESKGRLNTNRHVSGRQSYTAYNNMARPQSRMGMDASHRPSQQITPSGRATHRFAEEVAFEKRSDAEGVMSALKDRIDEYGAATVTYFYELVGITGNYIDDGFAWFDLEGYGVERVRGQFFLNLPKPEPLN